MFVNRVDTLPRVCNNADMTEIRVTPNTELRGAAIRYYDFERIMSDEWCDLVNDALEVAYPGVSFCDHGDLNLLVRGNGRDDVSAQIDYLAFECRSEDDLRAYIAHPTPPPDPGPYYLMWVADDNRPDAGHVCAWEDSAIAITQSLWVATITNGIARRVRKVTAWDDRTARQFAAECAAHAGMPPADDPNPNAKTAAAAAAWDACFYVVHHRGWEAERAWQADRLGVLCGLNRTEFA